MARLLRGEVELVPHARLVAISVLTGRERGISQDELQLIASLPSQGWQSIADLELGGRPVDAGEIRDLALAGIVITDLEDEPLAALRSLDQRLTEIGWSPQAALYHTCAKWRDVDVGELPVADPADESLRAKPPGTFHMLPGERPTIDLPFEPRETGLFRLLVERKTTRGFDPDAQLTLDQLSLLLYYTFGSQGFSDLGHGVVVLKKTSPSGGSLHPIEAYPLIVGVDGLAPGLYHYRIDRHALELVTPLAASDARKLLVECCAGQSYLSTASLLVIMTARFDRSFWKYRHPRAYAVLHMDAAHLSQTFYLVCAELGLGAFVSAAVNAGNIEEHLGVDGFVEGVIAVCGCGRPAARSSPFDAAFEPYVPRETVLD